MQIMQSRRRFLIGSHWPGPQASSATEVASARSRRRKRPRSACSRSCLRTAMPPSYVAGELLRAEGFADVRYVDGEATSTRRCDWRAASSDFDWNFAATFIASIEAGAPIKVLTGLHSGCLELIANDSINSIADLRGKKVGVYSLTSSPHLLVTLMAAYVGLDPAKDIEWVTERGHDPMELFVARQDRCVPRHPARAAGTARPQDRPHDPQQRGRPAVVAVFLLHAGRHADYVSRLSGRDQAGDAGHAQGRRSVRRRPAMRRRGAWSRAGSPTSYDYALQALNDVRYDRWRDFDPEDTVRFYALRMQETGLIKSSPQKIIAKGTDWRFLDELKRELKT